MTNKSIPASSKVERFFLPSLTGLRFVAALAILLAHAGDQAFAPYGIGFFSRLTGALAFFGMSLFFTLSGCVLILNYSHSFARNASFMHGLHSFGAARFARIVPLYIVIGVCFLAATPIQPVVTSKLLVYATLTQSWWGIGSDGADYFMHYFPHSWSISTEWFFYLIFPAICFLTGRQNSPRSLFSMAVGTLLSFLLLFIVFHSAVEYGIFGSTHKAANLKWFTYFSPYSRLCEFILGCYLGKYILHRKGMELSHVVAQKLIWGSLIGIICVGTFATPHIGNLETNWLGYFSPSLLQAPFVATFVLVVALNGKSFARGIIESRLFTIGGDCSYSIYLLHPLFTIHFANPVGTLGWWWIEPMLRFSTMVCLSLFAAHGSYHMVEVPTRRFVRRILGA